MTDLKIINLPDQRAIEEAAALWALRLDEGNLSAADEAAFRAWYHASDLHKMAFDRLSKVWAGLDGLSDLTDLAAADDVKSALKSDRLVIFQQTRTRILVGAIAACFALVGILSASNAFWPANAGFEHVYQTALGEQQTVDLPDGSTVILNTDTALNVVFTSDARSVKLERGEAFFDVASDKSRPFSVDTDSGRVTAVGTAFSVRVLEEKIDVVVTHGRVALAPALLEPTETVVYSAIAEPRNMEITAGQAATFAQGVEALDQIAPVEIERRLDWRDGMLAFKGEPLEQVVRDISRYTDLVIEIDGDEIRQQPIGGYFKVGETDALLEALATLSDLEIEQVDDSRIRITRPN